LAGSADQSQQLHQLNNLGAAYNQLGNDVEAVACYQQAIALNLDSAQLYNNLGSKLNNLARDEESVPYYR